MHGCMVCVWPSSSVRVWDDFDYYGDISMDVRKMRGPM